MLLVALLACQSYPDEVTLSGQVLDDHAEDGAPVGGVTLALRDETESVAVTATAEDDGAFSILAPSATVFWLEVSGEGRVATTFDGYLGYADLTAEPGQIWSADADDLDALIADFSACPTVGEAGGVVAGEVRLYIPGNDTDSLPTVSTATVDLDASDGSDPTVCFLDDEGLSSADATLTGATGRFAAFGLPPGRLTVSVRYTVGSVRSDTWDRDVWVPEDGLVPLYPLWVELVD